MIPVLSRKEPEHEKFPGMVKITDGDFFVDSQFFSNDFLVLQARLVLIILYNKLKLGKL
jgi:hypothetical protein